MGKSKSEVLETIGKWLEKREGRIEFFTSLEESVRRSEALMERVKADKERLAADLIERQEALDLLRKEFKAVRWIDRERRKAGIGQPVTQIRETLSGAESTINIK